MRVSLDNLLTTKDLCRIFGRTSATIMNWRKWKDLPYIPLGGGDRPAIRFERKTIIAWAEVNDIPIIDKEWLSPKKVA